MGLKPFQGELKIVLQPLFSHLFEFHLIHDDTAVATVDKVQHVIVLEEV